MTQNVNEATVGPFHSSQFLSLVFIPLWQDLIKTTVEKKSYFWTSCDIRKKYLVVYIMNDVQERDAAHF